jgi:hypothetical protein
VPCGEFGGRRGAEKEEAVEEEDEGVSRDAAAAAHSLKHRPAGQRQNKHERMDQTARHAEKWDRSSRRNSTATDEIRV